MASNLNFYQNYNPTNLGQHTYLSKGVKIWQTIPTELKELPIHTFKKKLKKHLLCLLGQTNNTG